MFLGMAGSQRTASTQRATRHKPTESDAYKALLTAQDALQQQEHSQAAHAACVAALLDLLAFQLKQAEAAYSRAVPAASAVAAVHETRAKLEQSLTAVWDMVDWSTTSTAAPGAVTFDSLYSEPSILGAMQFCRFFASPAGLAVMHKAAGMQQNQQQQQEQQQNKQQHNQQEEQQQQRKQRPPPFTLVVDPKGTGHAFTLQSALDMAALAAAQHAQQHYPAAGSTSSHLASSSSSKSSRSCSRYMDQSPAKHRSSGHMGQSPAKCSNSSSSKIMAATSSSNTASTRLDQFPAKHNNCSSSTTKQASGVIDSRRASDEVLVVLLPGTYIECCTLPATIKHITISGIRGSKALLCQQQQQQKQLLPLDVSLGQLQLQQQPAVQASLAGAAALITCPAGVGLSLQHLQLQMAQVYNADEAACSQCVLLRHGSAPAGISDCSFSFAATRSNSSCNGQSSGGSSSRSSGIATAGSSELYCIRACGSSQVSLEGCEFAGCAGGVLAEAGAAVTAQQCSYNDSCGSSRHVVVHEFETLDAAAADC